jgi:multiple sugar transport system ATP-binding protein
MTMGHRIAVLDGGVLQQCDTSRVVYDRPANTFVAGFIGSPAMNLFAAPVENGAARIGDLLVPLSEPVLGELHRARLTEIVLGVRPESIDVGASGAALDVDAVEVLGADSFLYGRLQGNTKMVARVAGRSAPKQGDRLRISFRPGEIHAFDPRTRRRLG